MEKLTVIKVGGKIVEEEESLQQLLKDFSAIEGYKVLVHGGGRSATKIAAQLGIESQMVNGRRITDAEMLKVVTMVYGGLVNKNIVAKLQACGVNALGLTGADMNAIRSHKRPVKDVDYGFVGDVDEANGKMLSTLILQGIVPVMAPLTHDGNGNLLNTNADTIAGETAKALSKFFDVTLVYCFEKKGVLRDANDDDSVIPHITEPEFKQLVEQGIVEGGMIPKLENAFNAIHSGVKKVNITLSTAIDGKLPLKNKLYRLALRITMDTGEAEDVVQDTLIRVWNKRDEWDELESIEAYCMTICKNLSLDRHEKKDAQNIQLDEALHDSAEISDNPESSLELKDRVELVHRLINSLPDKQKIAIQLREIEGKNYKDIADIMGITEEDVKVSIFRGRQKIKQKFLEFENYGL